MTQTRMKQPFRLYRGRRELAIQGGYFFGGARMPHPFLRGAAFYGEGGEWRSWLIINKSWIFKSLLLWCQVVFAKTWKQMMPIPTSRILITLSFLALLVGLMSVSWQFKTSERPSPRILLSPLSGPAPSPFEKLNRLWLSLFTQWISNATNCSSKQPKTSSTKSCSQRRHPKRA